MRTLFIIVLTATGISAIVLITRKVCCAAPAPPSSVTSSAVPAPLAAMQTEMPDTERFILTGNYAAREDATFCTTYDTLVIARMPENSLYRVRRKSWLHLHTPGGNAFTRRYINTCTASYDEDAGTLHCFPSGERGIVSKACGEVIFGNLVYAKIE